MFSSCEKICIIELVKKLLEQIVYNIRFSLKRFSNYFQSIFHEFNNILP